MKKKTGFSRVDKIKLEKEHLIEKLLQKKLQGKGINHACSPAMIDQKFFDVKFPQE